MPYIGPIPPRGPRAENPRHGTEPTHQLPKRPTQLLLPLDPRRFHPATGLPIAYPPTPHFAQQDHAMAHPGYGNAQYANQYPGYDQYAQSQQYQATPHISNPFAAPPPARSAYGQQNASYDPVHEQELAQWQSAYAPKDPNESTKGGKDVKAGNANLTALGVRPNATQETSEAKAKPAVDDGKKKTVVRQGGGETWEDETLLEWDPTKFRIYVGNLAGEVTDDSLAKAFAAYDVNKARVVRDKRTTKSKGFGFVEFQDHELGFRAAREMVNKYVGSHPITIQKAKTDVKASVQKDNKRGKNGKGRDKGGKKKDDPLRANTGAHIEKAPVRNPNIKMLG